MSYLYYFFEDFQYEPAIFKSRKSEKVCFRENGVSLMPLKAKDPLRTNEKFISLRQKIDNRLLRQSTTPVTTCMSAREKTSPSK